MRSINPATGEIIEEFTSHSEREVADRIEAAEQAFESWRARPFSERAEFLRAAAEHLLDHKERLAHRMTAEMGKPIDQARSEVEKCGWVCDYFADHGADFLKPRTIETDATRSQVVFEPLGTILAIMPWNFPLWQVFRFAAPTLMAGNVALLSHAANVGGCAADITSIFADVGLPTGVFEHLYIDNDTTGEVLRHPSVRGVTLTGSVRAGRAVGAIAGEELKPCVLELGGSDPFLVLEDCDLDWTIERGVFARMMNNGQSCIAAKRFIVERKIYDEFVARFTDAVNALTLGDPADEATDVGPMARGDLRDELHRQVTETIDAGARCVTGGEPIDGPGFFYKPTVLVDVTPGMAAFDEETFGPAAAIIAADDVDHAIELANQSPFGLGASIWTTPQRGQDLAPRIDAGAVFINELVKSDPRLPFGGIKDSGLGRELASFGIEEFVNIKTVYVR